MLSETSNPARSPGGHYMAGHGYRLVVFASARLPSRAGPVWSLLAIVADPGRAS